MKRSTIALLLALLMAVSIVPTVQADYGFEVTVMAALYNPVDMEDEFWKGAQERLDTKINIEWVPYQEFETKMELLIASNDIPELMSVEGARQPNLERAIAEGYFWDLKPYLGDFSKYPNMKANIPAMAWDYLAFGDGYYRIPRPRSYINTGFIVREDWFEMAGYPDISILTIDEVTDALEKIVNGDYDGNGIADTIGTHFVEEAGAAFGMWDMMPDAEGKIWPVQFSDGYTDMVAWYADIYSRGLMSEEFAVIQDAQYDEMVRAGRIAMKFKNIWHCYTMSDEAQRVQPGAKVRPLTVITNGDYVASRFDPGYVGALLISKKVSEERMLAILDYVEKGLTVEFSDYVTYGDLGYHHEIVDDAPVLTEIGQQQINNSSNIPFAIYCPEWFKVDSPVAPKAFNEEIRGRVQIMYEYGRVNPYQVIASETWSTEYGAIRNDFEAMRAKAISGAIPMDEYRAYVAQMRQDPIVIQAAEEFTASRNSFFPEGNLKLGR